MSLLMGSGAAVVVVFFLSKFRCDLPLRKRLKDSRSDFFNDFRLDIGLSSELAMSEIAKSSFKQTFYMGQFYGHHHTNRFFF